MADQNKRPRKHKTSRPLCNQNGGRNNIAKNGQKYAKYSSIDAQQEYHLAIKIRTIFVQVMGRQSGHKKLAYQQTADKP